MLSFKGYLKEGFIRKPKMVVGFASIHKHAKGIDEKLRLLDELKNKLKVITGFATIHKNDDSDKKLKEDATLHHNPLTGIDNYHQKHLDYRTNLVKGAISNFAEVRDKAELAPFEHHHELNTNLGHGKTELEKHHATELIRHYTADSSDLNGSLIEKRPLQGHSAKIDKELQKHTNHKANALKSDAIVHSGIGMHFAKIMRGTKIGDKIHMPAYTSTSTSPKVAKSFTDGEYGDRHFLHFHLPKGFTKARHVSNISEHSHEKEVIIHKNTKWKKVGYHHEPANDVEDTDSHHHHLIPWNSED